MMRIDGRGVERDGELVMAVGELASGRKFVGLLGVSGEEGGERALIDVLAGVVAEQERGGFLIVRLPGVEKLVGRCQRENVVGVDGGYGLGLGAGRKRERKSENECERDEMTWTQRKILIAVGAELCAEDAEGIRVVGSTARRS